MLRFFFVWTLKGLVMFYIGVTVVTTFNTYTYTHTHSNKETTGECCQWQKLDDWQPFKTTTTKPKFNAITNFFEKKNKKKQK